MRDVSRGTSSVKDQIKLMVKACSALGLELKGPDIERFTIYLGELLLWNKRINLVSRKNTETIALHHFIDALSLLPNVELPLGARIMDIGTGAGIPGFPIKICRPDIRLTLVESTRKKALFLRHIVEILQMDHVVIYQDRAENLKHQTSQRDSYDLVAARAVASLQNLVRLALPFLVPGGLFVAYKGGSTEEELAEAMPELISGGGQVEKQVKFRLPVVNKERQLIIIKKVA